MPEHEPAAIQSSEKEPISSVDDEVLTALHALQPDLRTEDLDEARYVAGAVNQHIDQQTRTADIFNAKARNSHDGFGGGSYDRSVAYRAEEEMTKSSIDRLIGSVERNYDAVMSAVDELRAVAAAASTPEQLAAKEKMEESIHRVLEDAGIEGKDEGIGVSPLVMLESKDMRIAQAYAKKAGGVTERIDDPLKAYHSAAVENDHRDYAIRTAKEAGIYRDKARETGESEDYQKSKELFGDAAKAVGNIVDRQALVEDRYDTAMRDVKRVLESIEGAETPEELRRKELVEEQIQEYLENSSIVGEHVPGKELSVYDIQHHYNGFQAASQNAMRLRRMIRQRQEESKAA